VLFLARRRIRSVGLIRAIRADRAGRCSDTACAVVNTYSRLHYLSVLELPPAGDTLASSMLGSGVLGCLGHLWRCSLE
jgi:hypothetical protein